MDIHTHLSILAKEQMRKETVSKESVTLAIQKNPLTVDVETGSNSFDEPQNPIKSTRSNHKSPPKWRVDTDEVDYEHELEKELEYFDNDIELTSEAARHASETSSCSVADAILLTGRDSLVGGGPDMHIDYIPSKEGRLMRLLNRLNGHVTCSQGAGGKPFQILTDAGMCRANKL